MRRIKERAAHLYSNNGLYPSYELVKVYKTSMSFMLEKIFLNRESSVYSCIPENSAVKKDRVKPGHRIELFIITNVHRKNDHKEHSFVNLLLASLTKVPRMILELSVKKLLPLRGVSLI